MFWTSRLSIVSLGLEKDLFAGFARACDEFFVMACIVLIGNL
jgi:hypothetical protein